MSETAARRRRIVALIGEQSTAFLLNDGAGRDKDWDEIGAMTKDQLDAELKWYGVDTRPAMHAVRAALAMKAEILPHDPATAISRRGY